MNEYKGLTFQARNYYILALSGSSDETNVGNVDNVSPPPQVDPALLKPWGQMRPGRMMLGVEGRLKRHPGPCHCPSSIHPQCP